MTNQIHKVARHATRALRSVAYKALAPVARRVLRRGPWLGVYRRFQDVPTLPASHETFVDFSTRGYVQYLLDPQRAHSTIPADTHGEYMLLGLLAAAEGRSGAPFAVLDFGGGVGADFLHLTRSLVKARPIDYHVVEIEAAVHEGERLFAGESRIHFHTSIPTVGTFDVVLIKSALCYVEDYAGVVERLCALSPRFVFLANLVAGEFSTFATAQRNIPGAVMAYWFFNIHEIVAMLARHGYPLIYRSTNEPVYHFPVPAPVQQTCNLLFERREGHS